MNSVFDKHYKKYDLWYDRHPYAYLSELEAVKKLLPEKGKGLEIGTGTGRFASALGIQYAVEPSSKMARLARRRGVEVYLAYGTGLPFTDSGFDYVAIIITLCFVKNPEKVLEEVYRVLKENGRVIIGIVDKNSFLGRYYAKKKSIFYKQAEFFTVKEITSLLKKTGFNNFLYYQTLFDLPESMSKPSKPKKGFGNGGFVVISGKKQKKGAKNGNRSK